MISNKKAYAMKMLQLALALSLLQVDPDNYLQQQLYNWDTELELHHGHGWELEMLRAVPMVEYPYANRKSMMPLIEDLIRYDREREIIPPNQYNITAYLLNVQTDGANQTAALQEVQSLPSGGIVNSATSGNAATAAVVLEQAAATTTNNTNTLIGGVTTPEIDYFINLEQFQDQRSIWEQNLADLNDFGDFPLFSTYNNFPLKDEPQNHSYVDINLEAFLPGLVDNAENIATIATAENVVESAGALNGTFPNPDDTITVKLEQVDKDDENDEVPSCSTAHIIDDASDVKLEKFEEYIENGDEQENEFGVDLSPFINQVELTTEESEIVEVLWKQDVDLGFSLNQPDVSINNGIENGSVVNVKSFEHSGDNVDDIEKLKALEELKLDKVKYDKNETNDVELDNEWAGIPFTIDNETGEYIRLPLDELLNDVLQLAEFAVDNESNDDSIASTSKAAAAAAAAAANTNNKKNDNLKKSENNHGKNKENKNEEGELLSNDDDLPQSEIEVSSIASPLFDLDDAAKEELADLDIMLQSAAPPFHHHHHHHHHHPHHPHRPTATGVHNYAVGGGANSAFQRQAATGFHHGHHQGRMPLSRTVSMDQRLQDIASLFNPIPSMGVDVPPYHHYPTHHYSYQSAAQHGQYPPPPPPPHPHHPHGHHAAAAMLHHNATLGDICPTQPHYGHNLGSAVSSSMHLTNVSHDGADVGASAVAGNVGAYKMEHDMMYYSNASSDINHTTDGFINSILNDEDLHLMDMNVNDTFCRMVDVNNSTSNNSSVLGISSGHASGGGSSAGAGTTSNGLSMNTASGGGGASGGAVIGMTVDLIGSGAQSGATDRLDASSDSAVSSMGSERVPSLSDGEWGEGSDSAQDYHQGKYGGPYDYSYNNNNNNRLNDGTRQPPVAQKKHQMFGKRYLHDQPGMGNNDSAAGAVGGLLHGGPAQSIKYEYDNYTSVAAAASLQQSSGSVGGGGLLGEGVGAIGPVLSKEQQAYDLKYASAGAMGGGAYSLDFSLRTPRTPHEIVTHNHTYALPQGTGSIPRPQQRDKKTSTSSSSKSSRSSISGDDEHLTRDEKRARSLNIPIIVNDIINLPMDEFNERLSKYDLTESQLSLIRDIRRRGKNKVAAQNCRKRKLDQILSLEDEVKEVRRRKEQLLSDHKSLTTERARIANKFAALHRHIFQYLRDPAGNPCSPTEYSLQQATNGSVYLLKRDGNNKADAADSISLTPFMNHTNPSNGNRATGTSLQQQQHNGNMTVNGSIGQHHMQQQHHHHHHQQQQHVIGQAHGGSGGHHTAQQPQQQQQQQQQQQSHHTHTHVPNTLHHQTHQKD